MIQIKKITFHTIRLPLVEPFQISSGTTTVREIVLLEIENSDGLVVWSECVAGERPIYSPETGDICKLVIKNWLAKEVLTASFERPEDVHHALNKIYKGHLMAKAALEMPCWVISAHQKNQSLSEFIGGARKYVDSGLSIGIKNTPEDLCKTVEKALVTGYKKIKLKIKPHFDVAYIDAVRRQFGNKVTLMVDANNAYALSDIDHLKTFDQYELLMIEQPFSWDDIYQHSKLQSQIKTPVCLDESIHTLDHAIQMKELNAGKIINIKPGRVGGFTQAIAIHDYCDAQGIPVWCGGMLETGIGKAYNIALASKSNFTLPGDLSPSSRYWAKDVTTRPWELQNGQFEVPTSIGLGVEVDKDYIREITIEKEVLCL